MTDANPTDLAGALRDLRHSADTPLRSVAEAVGCSASSISDAERGAALPRWNLVERIVRHLDGDIDRFRTLHKAAVTQRYSPNDATAHPADPPSVLRHLAVILDEGRKAAERLEDAPLSAALAAMTETAVMLHENLHGWDIERDFNALAERFR